jgi:hypothetical protein
MATYLPQNQFISNSVSHVPVDTGSAAASPCPHSTAAAVAISVSDGGPPVSSGKEGAVSVIAAPSDIDCISEIFFYARKLMKQPPRFVLDEAEFMAEVEEEPLFLRDGDHLRRWTA